MRIFAQCRCKHFTALAGMLFHSTDPLIELPPEDIANLNDAGLKVGGNVLLHLHGNVCTVDVEFHAHRLAQSPLSLFEVNVSLGN